MKLLSVSLLNSWNISIWSYHILMQSKLKQVRWQNFIYVHFCSLLSNFTQQKLGTFVLETWLGRWNAQVSSCRWVFPGENVLEGSIWRAKIKVCISQILESNTNTGSAIANKIYHPGTKEMKSQIISLKSMMHFSYLFFILRKCNLLQTLPVIILRYH